MANFQTHITGAIIASSLAASAALSLQLVNQEEVIALWVLGTLGGILPDVDSDHSTAMEIIFSILAVMMVLFVAQSLSPYLSIIGLWLVSVLVFILIRYVAIKLFEQFTVHRGSIHSLLACLMFGLFTIHLNLWAGTETSFAWCAGIILVFGMLVHLCLDEFYSVDFSNRNIKKSFGSALKICSLEYPLATVCQLIICGVLTYSVLPSYQQFAHKVEQQQVRFLPDEEWKMLHSFLKSSY